MMQWRQYGSWWLMAIMMISGASVQFSDAASVRTIIGSNVDASEPPPPTGCGPASTFDIVPGTVTSTFSTGGASIGHDFVVTPKYQNYVGAVFQVARDTTGAELFIGSVISRSPATFTASIEFSTANNPVVSNTHGTIADTTNSRVLIHATRVVAPCAGTNCLQLLLYSTNDSTPVLVSDVTFSAIDASQGSLGGVYDGTYWYFFQRDGLTATTNIFQFNTDTGLTIVTGASIGNINPSVMIDDGTSLLAINTAGTTLLQINRTSLVVTPLSITGISGTLTDQLAYDPTANVLYVATTNVGVTTLRQINRTTGVATGVTASLGTETLLHQGLQVDVNAGKLYAATDVTGTTTRLRRYNAQTMSAEETDSSVVGQPSSTAAPDFIHKRLWFSGAGSPGFVQPFQLCS